LLPVSATYIVPAELTAIPLGEENWPGPEPVEPKAAMKAPCPLSSCTRFAAAAVVGDAESDIQAGLRVGATTVLLGTDGASDGHGADHVAGTLLDAVEWLSVARGLGDGLDVH
jgi:phosphoglycolate phosphatase-like HAD superfamily hydrolase